MLAGEEVLKRYQVVILEAAVEDMLWLKLNEKKE